MDRIFTFLWYCKASFSHLSSRGVSSASAYKLLIYEALEALFLRFRGLKERVFLSMIILRIRIRCCRNPFLIELKPSKLFVKIFGSTLH